jgi:hypothetical protein
MSITLAQAKSLLAQWLAADAALANGQAYNIGDISVTKVDGRIVTEKIKYYSGLVQSLSGGGPRMKRIVPRSL